jgi:hypothetical protein
MYGYDDWANVSLNFRGASEFSDGAFTSFDAVDEQSGTASFDATGPHGTPNVNSITAPLNAFNIDTSQTFKATFIDPEGFNSNSVEETYSSNITWNDGTSSSGQITIDKHPSSSDLTATGTITASHQYSKPGKYKISVTVTDSDNHSDTSTYPLWIMVYDKKSKSEVHGNNKFISPAGAFRPLDSAGKTTGLPDNTFSGIGKFELEGHYQKDQRLEGKIDFHVYPTMPDSKKIFDFESNSFDWFLINRNTNSDPIPDEAYIKGVGKIVGKEGTYGFTASVVDGNIKGGNGKDLVRIRIYSDPTTAGSEFDNSKILYDNMCTDLDPNTQNIEACALNYERVFSSQIISDGTVGIKVS